MNEALEMQEKDLVKYVESTGLVEDKVHALMDNYSAYFARARKLVVGAMDIKIENEDQLGEMEDARNRRLGLRGLRLEVEKTRKALKAQSLREGKAIDGAANIIKALIAPAEEYLQDQEKFAERMQEIREQKLIDTRAGELEKFGVKDPANLYDLGAMEKRTFTHLLATHEKAFNAEQDARLEAERAEHAEREAEEAERERVKAENEALKVELKEREDLARKEADERTKLETARKAEEARKLKVEQEKQAKLQEEQDVKWKVEQEKQAKLQKELDDRKEAEEAQKRAEEETRRKALLAPDRDKLIDLAGRIRKISMPHVETKEAGLVVNETGVRLGDLAEFLVLKAKAL